MTIQTVSNTRMRNIQKEVEALHSELKRILYFSDDSKNLDFCISSLTEYNPFYTTHEIAEWLHSLNKVAYFEVKQIPLTQLRQWYFDKDTGDLLHSSGCFFSIRGIRVKTNIGCILEWSQPVIYQPEIGILGIITKKINGILYFLIQAKAEPGNINTFQLSPTVQATRSNYTQIHGGKSTLYLEYFLNRSKAEVLIDQLQSEQGARFLRKRNRNIIVRLRDEEDIALGENFRWLTLGQIQQLAQKDNTVNMDSRSVISAINFEPEHLISLEPVDVLRLKGCLEKSTIVTKPVRDFGIMSLVSSHPNSASLHTMDELLQIITSEKFKCRLETQLIPLKDVESWKCDPEEIYHEERKYFSVIGVRIKAADREVFSWDQPIIQQHHTGIVGFITKEIDGVVHYLAQLKMESGVLDLLEIAPTVQCITDNYSLDDLPLYTKDFLERNNTTAIIDTYQSEEGGRFYHESNQNILLLAKGEFVLQEPPFFMWATLGQLKQFIKFNNFINVEARSLLSCVQMR